MNIVKKIALVAMVIGTPIVHAQGFDQASEFLKKYSDSVVVFMLNSGETLKVKAGDLLSVSQKIVTNNTSKASSFVKSAGEKTLTLTHSVAQTLMGKLELILSKKYLLATTGAIVFTYGVYRYGKNSTRPLIIVNAQGDSAELKAYANDFIYSLKEEMLFLKETSHLNERAYTLFGVSELNTLVQDFNKTRYVFVKHDKLSKIIKILEAISQGL